MQHKRWRFALVLACLLLPARLGSLPRFAKTDLRTRSDLKVGMSSRTFKPGEPYDWRGAKTHALVATVWYPAAAGAVERPIEIPGMSELFVLGHAAQDAHLAPMPTNYPLVVLSHGTGGSALQMAWLGTALAANGFIAVAVNHPGNNATEPYTAQGFSTWWERARDLSVVVDSMLADPTFGRHIDSHRIGAAGFSLGGYTMIEIAGGTTDVGAFRQFCASQRVALVCQSPPEFPTLLEDFDKLSTTDTQFQAALAHAGDSYRDTRVRAVFAIAPPLGPAFRPASLGAISIPVRIVAGKADTMAPIAYGAEYFASNIPGAKLTIFPGNVGHYVFLDTCTAAGRKTLALLCADGEGVDREAIHAGTAAFAVEFFRETLN
jgi:predicted dienelactone hydrolase